MRKKLIKEQRMEVYKKCNGYCAYCGCELEFKDMQADHIIPLYNGGLDEPKNMLPACRSCNKYKHTMSIEKFRSALERMPAVLERDSVTYRIAKRYGLVLPGKPRIQFYFETQEPEGE